MNKSLFYTASYISCKLREYQINRFFTQTDPVLKSIEKDDTDHVEHILFYASLKKSFRTIIKDFMQMDEATLYGALHMLNMHLYPFETLRKKESIILVDNHCKPTTLSSNAKKYHDTLNQLIQEIYHEVQEEHAIQKYRDDVSFSLNRSALVNKLYNDDNLNFATANRIAKKIPFYAKNSSLSVEQEVESHLLSLYMQHYIKPSDEIYLFLSEETAHFPIHNEAWYQLAREYFPRAENSSHSSQL